MSRLFLYLSIIFYSLCTAPAGPAGTEPVIFWAHYMPMIPHGHMHAHPHAGGNHDAWPFNTQNATAEEDYEEDMRQALESGINGFQMLTFVPEEAFVAARKIRVKTGKMFHIAPQWIFPKDKSTDAMEKNIGAFYAKYSGDPHVYTRGGNQVHFVYGGSDPKPLDALQKRLQAQGVKVLLTPLERNLDSPSLSAEALESTDLRVVQGWTHKAPDPAQARALHERLAPLRPEGFLYIPGVAAGYDSSNRAGQFIRVPFHGIRTLLNSLRTWTDLGYRQIHLITWNDPHESLEVPSSRNIWGHNAILRFFRGLVEEGKSPFTAPKAVVSYPVDSLLGDRFFFQVLGLPSAGQAIEWRAVVELHPLGWPGGGDPIVLRGTGKGEGHAESLIEMTWETSGAAGTVAGVQPVISVEYRTASEGEWKALYSNLALPPTRLRYNLVQSPVPYAIDLSRIASRPALALSVNSSPLLDRVALKVAGPTDAIRRLNLVEGTRSLGAFREPSTEKGFTYQNLFVRIEASEDRPLVLAAKNGVIRDIYGLNGRLENALIPVNGPNMPFALKTPDSKFAVRVARVDLAEDGKLILDLRNPVGKTPPAAGLEELKKGVRHTVPLEKGGSAVLSMILTTDLTDPNIDFPVKSAMLERSLALRLDRNGPALLYAMAWLKSDQVAISPPVWAGVPPGDPLLPAQWIDTRGTFDDFVDGGSSLTLNPFDAGQIVTGFLPESGIPWFRLGLDEGAGVRLNDGGTSQQAGRAVIEEGGLKRDAAANPGTAAKSRWIDQGVRGKALQLGEGSVIRFRSKSEPVGAETISLWVEVKDGDREAGKLWSTLRAGPFRLKLLSDNSVSIGFQRAGLKLDRDASLTFKPGWNHLAFVYDLASVRLYLNGVEAAEMAAPTPAYQRTHTAPGIAFGDPRIRGDGFSGALDEIQVIGTGLGGGAISGFFQEGSSPQ